MNVSVILNAVVWLPWAVLGVGGPLVAYWMLEPAPLRITHVAAHFTSVPAGDAEEAKRHAITEVAGGATIYRYVEYCVDRPFSATMHRTWVNRALVWHAPDLPTVLSRTPGCATVAMPVDVPTSSPTRTFDYVAWMDIRVNPLRVERIEYPPIRLKILDGAGK